MVCDRIYDRPWVSRLVLLGGGIVYFSLCIRLCGSYSSVHDPYSLANVWMWIPPVIVSAIFCSWNKRRLIDLVWYSIVVGYVFSLAAIEIMPARKTPIQAFRDMIIFAPLMITGVCFIECVSRFILKYIRSFLPKPNCVKCGYSLQGLSVARCPECGTEFPDVLLQEDYKPETTPVLRRRTTLVIAVVVFMSVAFPFGWERYIIHLRVEDGREAAKRDWVSGDVTWYISKEEIEGLSDEAMESAFRRLHGVDSETGWTLEPMGWDWNRRVWQSAYREMIEQKLKEAGREVPKFE